MKMRVVDRATAANAVLQVGEAGVGVALPLRETAGEAGREIEDDDR